MTKKKESPEERLIEVIKVYRKIAKETQKLNGRILREWKRSNTIWLVLSLLIYVYGILLGIGIGRIW